MEPADRLTRWVATAMKGAFSRAMNQQAIQKHAHRRTDIRTRCADCGHELGQQVFNRADLETQQVTELPEREAMSLINANVAAPINLALAANVLSDGSVALASAQQYAPMTETT